MLEDQLLLRLGLSVAGENQFAAIGGGKVNVEQLHGVRLSSALRAVRPGARGLSCITNVTCRQ